MTKYISLGIIIIILCTYESNYSQYEEENIIAEWNFDSIVSRQVKESVSGSLDSISGHFDILDGVVGQAIKCDGFTNSG